MELARLQKSAIKNGPLFDKLMRQEFDFNLLDNQQFHKTILKNFEEQKALFKEKMGQKNYEVQYSSDGSQEDAIDVHEEYYSEGSEDGYVEGGRTQESIRKDVKLLIGDDNQVQITFSTFTNPKNQSATKKPSLSE